jgi:hypothetical protein
MKKKSTARVILYVSIVILGSLLFSACPQPDKDESVSIEERIDAFIEDANNGNYSNMYTHIHPDAAKYDQSKTGDFWTDDFSDNDHSLGTLNISGEVVTAKIDSDPTYNSDDIRFTMKEDGKKVWKILKLEIDTGSGYQVIVD